MNDLFGQPIVDEPPKLTNFGKRKRDETPKGYAAPPGSGPEGHFCRDCRHAKCNLGYRKHYWKCALLCQRWTNSYSTDIRLKSPACEHWTPKAQVDPDSKNKLAMIQTPPRCCAKCGEVIRKTQKWMWNGGNFYCGLCMSEL